MAATVTIDQAATLLKVSRRTIYNRIKEGKLQTVRTRLGSQRIIVGSLIYARPTKVARRGSTVGEVIPPEDPDESHGPPSRLRFVPLSAEPEKDFVAEAEHQCPMCAGLQMTCIHSGAFALEWRCDRCGHVFMDPLLSVVFIDGNRRRREALVTCLTQEGIPVVAASSVSELEFWPVGKVLVTSVRSVTPLWFDVGATHVVVLANSDEERVLAADISHEHATVADGTPASLLASLRLVAMTIAARQDGHGGPDRRTGPPRGGTPPPLWRW